MDAGVIFVLLVAAGLVVLLALAARRMLRGDLGAGASPKEIEAETQTDRELAREALGEIPPLPSQPPPEGEAPPVEAAESQGTAYRRGLSKTRDGLMARMNALLFGGRAIDPSLIDELEEVLVTADVGIRTAQRLLGDLRERIGKKEVGDPEAIRSRLQQTILEILSVPLPPQPAQKPLVLMVIGVNGVGKTTTIGKVAARYAREGKKVVLAAGDTFRAAAVEQLEVWATRSGAELVKGPEAGDPSSVAFDAVQTAVRIGADVCIADTAGRLHTKVNLMEELKKLRRVMDKALPGAPHEVLLVLDATTGQNAITQAQQFTEAVQVSSLALTKLDGTAKGGVVVAICDALKLPVRYVGVGERVEDLRDFDAQAFVDALFEREDRISTGDRITAS
jgi:fused signal recognition particle receptor